MVTIAQLKICIFNYQQWILNKMNKIMDFLGFTEIKKVFKLIWVKKCADILTQIDKKMKIFKFLKIFWVKIKVLVM